MQHLQDPVVLLWMIFSGHPQMPSTVFVAIQNESDHFNELSTEGNYIHEFENQE
jgi:hypothetical protein